MILVVVVRMLQVARVVEGSSCIYASIRPDLANRIDKHLKWEGDGKGN